MKEISEEHLGKQTTKKLEYTRKTEQQIAEEKRQGLSHDEEQKLKRSDDYEFNKNLKKFIQTYIFKPIFICLAAAIMVLFFTVVIHLILPEKLAWLSEQKTQKIENLLKAGAVGALVSQFMRKLLG